MNPTLDELVVTDANRCAFERVINITQANDAPVMIYIYGPKGSGKTFALQARFFDRDLLSKRKVVFTHSVELITAFQLDLGDELLSEVGDADILLLDAFDLFFESGDIGPLLCKLLLQERGKRGLSTVITGRKPLSSYDLSSFEGALDSFEEVGVAPLGREDFEQLALKVQSACRKGKSEAPELSDGAIAFIASEYAQSLRDVRNAVCYLLTAAGFEGGRVVDEFEARSALAI